MKIKKSRFILVIKLIGSNGNEIKEHKITEEINFEGEDVSTDKILKQTIKKVRSALTNIKDSD